MIKVYYAMTINKSQAQSSNFIGLYLSKPIFYYGQLYVVMSRVTLIKRIRFFMVEH